MAYRQTFFFIFFKLISQIDSNRIYAAWVEVFRTTIHHCLQISLGNTVEYLLAIYHDGYRLIEVNQLVVEINSQPSTCSYGIAAVELQINAPLLILQDSGIIHIAHLDGRLLQNVEYPVPEQRPGLALNI